MNEKIKELAGKALDQAVPQTWTTLAASDLTKFTEVFAELIVRECVGIVENQGKFSRYDTLAKKIKEHFGVK